MNINRFTQFMISILVISLISACGTKSIDNLEPTKDAPTLYKNFCLSCHGSNLEGFRGPNIQQIGARMTKEEIVIQIEKGADGMPGFKMSIRQPDIDKLASWLAEMK